jgi:crotonobetainyl-CoA:carnitine CoA-transferase CaiB-like acyl-CoA transferase
VRGPSDRRGLSDVHGPSDVPPSGPPAGTGDGPLEGRRVLDLATIYAGPLVAQLLGDFGAEVIKVEHPTRPDGLRGHGRQKDGIGLWWKMVGRNKRTIGLDLSAREGADLLLRLAETADVMVESFRPGTLERWGLGYDELAAVNPRLVLVRVTGFGQTGPYAPRPGFGTLIEAMSGFAARTGEPDGAPVLPPFGLADGIAGIAGAMAAMMALYHRDANGGSGQVVDLSVFEPLVTVLGPQPTTYDVLGEVPARTGNLSTNNAPRNTYRTSDGRWVAVSSSATSIAERVMRVVGRPDLIAEPWFATGAGRAAHTEVVDGAVAEWIAVRTCADVLDAFERADAAIAAVYDVADLVADPHVRSREILTTVPDADLGPLLMQNLIARLATSPGRIRFTGRSVGADTDEILVAELGLSSERVADLRARSIVA